MTIEAERVFIVPSKEASIQSPPSARPQRVALWPDNELVTSYAIDPMPDGTLRIPCPKGCDVKSSRQPECTAPKKSKHPCTWRAVVGCTYISDTPTGLANHTRSHTKDSRGPYQCKKDECGGFYADLYELAMHEHRCEGDRSSPERRTSYRFALTAAAREPPSVIVVNRSSPKAPESWKDGTNSLQDGLPNIGKKYLAHYAAWTTFNGAAVLHGCYNFLFLLWMTASQLRHKATGLNSIENLSSLKCGKNDFGTFHPDLYDLAMHEERCKGGPLSNRETSYRFSLTADAANGATPSVIIINRSSKAPAQCWKDGTASIKEGLPQLGRK